MNFDRREFLEFMGLSTGLVALGGLNLGFSSAPPKTLPFSPLAAQKVSDLKLVEGLSYERLASWGKPLNSQGDRFGSNADFIAFTALSEKEAILWVNHESVDPSLMSGWDGKSPRSKKDVTEEMLNVGGSLLHIKKTKAANWELVPDSKYNRRITGLTKIPFHNAKVLGQQMAQGTLGNCAGGVTPWGTILTAEENYQNFYGEAHYDEAGNRRVDRDCELRWHEHYDNPPEHYGWLVEIHPKTGAAKKHINLGRFAHECGTCTTTSDGRAVVYSGDDKTNECLYKFISKSSDNFDSGTLYVANLEKGEWLPLDVNQDEKLKKKFKTQDQLLVRTREAAALVGGSPLDRPEDVEIQPGSNHVFVTTTQNKEAGRLYGAILKIEEENGDSGSLKFKSSTFVSGSAETGFACPDNLVFDPQGNLWVTTDVSEKDIGKPAFKGIGSNGLFYIPLKGEHAGEVHRIANAPVDAELTGPCFSQDGKTLFVSVQHPGGEWPDKGQKPKSTVVAITGPTLEKLTLG